jgi:hypothetical protein
MICLFDSIRNYLALITMYQNQHDPPQAIQAPSESILFQS